MMGIDLTSYFFKSQLLTQFAASITALSYKGLENLQ